MSTGIQTLKAQTSEETFDPHQKKSANILGHKMAYIDIGEGRPVVFIHGNPASSYLWRNIIPYVMNDYRVIAPDLIGMGDSGKPDIDYSFQDQFDHLATLLDSLKLKNAILVIHDWGSGLGWTYARTRPETVSAVAFMDAMVPPVHPVPSYEAFGSFGEFAQKLRTPGIGEKMALEENIFIEEILSREMVVTPLSEETKAEYRRPFPTPESRKPLLAWPRQIPIGGEPEDVTKIIAASMQFVTDSEIPKLCLWATPGMLMPIPVVEYLRKNMKNTDFVYIGEGIHFVQEDQPDNIGKAIANWLEQL
ncbi:haloalkane dehalogenase [Marinifilum sp. JC070]|uniref:Haloalkane dehalogenase n=2 Tax=Marinifilum caeruleilacunae TaxID=2499076 RepID=A0ABX1WQJ2_9BACT|nr:haloalkane dehalogenase [Marinifilum caeruleilacunae]